MADNERYSRLMQLARMGWWEADFSNQRYLCSEFVANLLGLEGNAIGFWEFQGMIREDYRERITKEFASIKQQEVYEQTFPILTRYGVSWVHSRMDSKYVDEDGCLRALGFLQCVDAPDSDAYTEVNELLAFQGSISRSLLSFLQTEDMSQIIPNILSDVLRQFHGGRAYIFEFDPDGRSHSCVYEVTASGVSKEMDSLQNILVEDTPWWCNRVFSRKPVILFSLDDMPPEAELDRRVLSAQNIKSLMVVPLLSSNGVWGYMGIDIVDEHRQWSNEDYQWFASLANIVSICIQLRRSELKARSERLYLDSIYRHMPVGYIRLSVIRGDDGRLVDYRPLDYNDAAEAMVGFRLGDMQGRKLPNACSSLESDLAFFSEVLESDGYREANFLVPETGKRCHSIIYSPQPDEVVIIFSDMTETLAANEALDRSEKILRNIYKNLPVGIELYDKDGYLVDMNDKELELFGLASKDTALGVNVFHNPNIPDPVKEKLRRKEDVDFTLNYDFSRTRGYYPTRKQGIMNLVTKVTALYDSQNNFINYLFINIDTTETTTAYARLQEFESFFSMIADYAKVGYFKYNPLTGEGFAINQWFKNLNEPEGTAVGEVVGVHGTFHPDDRAAMREYYDKALSGEVRNVRREVRVRQADGSWKWLSYHVIVQEYAPERNEIDMLGINFDITEQKQVEEKLTEAKNKAEMLDRLKSAFLANMSHEIRTPLNAIVGFSNLLVDTTDPDERRQYISIVQENNDLLLQLISDILDLSKIEAGTFEFVKGPVDVNQLCSEMVISMRVKAAGSGVAVELADNLPRCSIVSDKNRLNQVLYNFITNALKFTDKGTVTVGYGLAGDGRIRFFVRDTGCGIPAEKQDAVFDRFVKLNNFVQGTGLGLPICKNIVEQMGGTIGVESTEGEGSCFWFTLPYNGYESSDGRSEAYAAVQPVRESNERPVILIAEDTDSNYLLLSTVLKKDYDLRRAHDGREAVGIHAAGGVDLILMDMKMPVMDGLEATGEIRKKDCAVPIIAVTAFAYDRDRQKALDAGCNDYMSKPIQAAALKEKIRTYLSR